MRPRTATLAHHGRFAAPPAPGVYAGGSTDTNLPGWMNSGEEVLEVRAPAAAQVGYEAISPYLPGNVGHQAGDALGRFWAALRAWFAGIKAKVKKAGVVTVAVGAVGVFVLLGGGTALGLAARKRRRSRR